MTGLRRVLSALLAPLARRLGSPRVAWTEAADLRDALGSATPPLVLDVRGTDEFVGPLGHIGTARNIPLDALALEAQGLTGDRPIVIVCRTDKRSAAAAALLGDAGLGAVTVLRGGMERWNAHGFETEGAAAT